MCKIFLEARPCYILKCTIGNVAKTHQLYEAHFANASNVDKARGILERIQYIVWHEHKIHNMWKTSWKSCAWNDQIPVIAFQQKKRTVVRKRTIWKKLCRMEWTWSSFLLIVNGSVGHGYMKDFLAHVQGTSGFSILLDRPSCQVVMVNKIRGGILWNVRKDRAMALWYRSFVAPPNGAISFP